MGPLINTISHKAILAPRKQFLPNVLTSGYIHYINTLGAISLQYCIILFIVNCESLHISKNIFLHIPPTLSHLNFLFFILYLHKSLVVELSNMDMDMVTPRDTELLLHTFCVVEKQDDLSKFN